MPLIQDHKKFAETHEKSCKCSCCYEHKLNGWEKKKKPQVELDGEITLYESSLSWFPFKE